MSLNLREMLIGTPTRLRYVIRFSTCHKVHPENVAEHSYYVALYAMLIADDISNSYVIDVDLLLRGALLHDLEEAATGDVNRIFKYSSHTMQMAMHNAARAVYKQMFERMGVINLHNTLTIWDKCKDDTYEGRILRFADFLSVLSYMLQELTNANITMREHWTTMRDYIAEFFGHEYDFIRRFVDEASEMLREGFDGASK